MTADLNLQMREQEGWLVVRFQGTINLMVRDHLREQIEAELNDRPDLDLVIDLSEVAAVDSAGLGTIFGLYKFLVERQKSMALVAPTREVANLLEMTHLDKVVRVKESLTELLG